MDHLHRRRDIIEHKQKLEAIGDDFALQGLHESAAKAYIFAHANSKLKFIMDASDPIRFDIAYDAIISHNYEAFRYLVVDKEKHITKKTLRFVFDSGSEKLLEFTMQSSFWKDGDPSLVASVSIMDHLRRVRTGKIDASAVNSVFENWGPLETRKLYVLTFMDAETAYTRFSRGQEQYTNRDHLKSLMLFAALAGVKETIASHELGRMVRDMTPRLIVELLEYHKYVILKTTDLRDLIIDKPEYLPDFVQILPILIQRTSDPILVELFYAYGSESVIAYLKSC